MEMVLSIEGKKMAGAKSQNQETGQTMPPNARDSYSLKERKTEM